VVVFTGVVALVFDATVVPVPEFALAAEPDEDAVPEAVFEAPVAVDTPVFDAEVLSLVSNPCERSIIPTLGDTRLGTESDAVEVAVVLPESDSLPQAARVSVARVHRTTLRICERAARANFVM
jgi:hypothetical protein